MTPWSVSYSRQLPLSPAVRDDPAFSPDPRSHPHFPLANAASYKALKSPSSLSSFSLYTTPHSPASPPPNTVSPLSTQPKVAQKHPPQRHFTLPASKIGLDSGTTLARDNMKPVALQNTSFPRKGRMKALVRRLTSRHNLDRIDELDETDPSGVGHHHNGPYEAIGGSLVQPFLPQRYSDHTPRGGHHSKQREFHLRPLRSGQHQSASRMPPIYDNTGLSLNLEPGQILQQNTIYRSHASSIVSVASQFQPQPNAIPIVARPNHTRSSPLPNIRTYPSDELPSSEFVDGFQNRPSSSLHVPPEHHFADNTPDIPTSLPPHHDRDTAPYVPRQIETAVFPPTRYEPRFHTSSLSRSSRRTTGSSIDPASWKTQSRESTVPTLPAHTPRRQSAPSLDSSHKPDSMIAQSTSSIQNKPWEHPRIRHLPKRLVMPTPLQPQPPVQHKSPSVGAAAWQDGYPDDHTIEGPRFEGQLAMYTQDRRLLRKRSTAFPAKTPIPDHIPMSQDDAVLIMRDSPTRTANEPEGAKERTRRRRLSKRKNDI